MFEAEVYAGAERALCNSNTGADDEGALGKNKACVPLMTVWHLALPLMSSLIFPRTARGPECHNDHGGGIGRARRMGVNRDPLYTHP